jgi:photosystem I reaction center subunit V
MLEERASNASAEYSAAFESIHASCWVSLCILQGRFVFLPFQRREAAFDDVGPKTTGTTFFDKLQEPSSFTTTSKVCPARSDVAPGLWVPS